MDYDQQWQRVQFWTHVVLPNPHRAPVMTRKRIMPGLAFALAN